MGVEIQPFFADLKDMALRIALRLPRLVVVCAVLLLVSATLAVGAAKRLTAVPNATPAPVAAAPLVVPDVTGQAFVFAKGSLEDTGFAWRVVGRVRGYAVNKVASQSPAAGTRLRDTGSPTITLQLERSAYPEKGDPEDISPYLGTAVTPFARPVRPVAPTASPRGAEKKAPATTGVATTTPSTSSRPPAFRVPNAPKEPVGEMPLTQRAKLLSAWIAAHPKPTSARVRHFLYQHTWIVTGARFGWWHGAEALRQLIAADRLAQQRWGIGRKSELAARRALAVVEASSH